MIWAHMLVDFALLVAGFLLLGAALSRNAPQRGLSPRFWDRSPDGALINAVLGVVLGAAAVIYATVDLLT
jgi:hypothetical protein